MSSQSPVATRSARFTTAANTEFDVVIVGAGINGSVVAAALASHGVSTLLVDRGDIGSYTSQASSNMVWGGFKYLEGFELKLVWDLCGSRNRMVSAYPTNVVPISFLANLDEDSPHRPWFGFLGTLAYWAFGRFKTAMPRYMTAAAIEAEAPVVDTSRSRGGIKYGDAYLPENDSRFVLQFALQAAACGATVLNHTEVRSLERVDGRWRFRLTDQLGGTEVTASAGIVVNAAGPFSADLNNRIDVKTDNKLAFSKGIHLIVDRLTTPDHILVFYDDTGRLFYVLPMGSKSSIGTTDTRVGEPTVEVTAEDREFLLEQINQRLDLDTPLTADDVISTRGGVRPLVVASDSGDTSAEDWTKLSRKHVIEVDKANSVISILGGKLTDCINVGEELIEIVGGLDTALTSPPAAWYGEPGDAERSEAISRCLSAGLPETTAERIWRRYGLRTHRFIEIVFEDTAMADPVFEFDDLRRGEVVLMAETEMVETLEDLLRRRTMLSLTHRHETLASSDGLKDCAQLLFGDLSSTEVNTYRTTTT